ncbi:MAG TPA: WecB/TagA/CpsF family glycosyltransferase [Syntrophomonadaceae bacterium]|nr:WecB/TagA/CpsF family glycosyltransferase [Syntrophomonadaceae bacterium]
MKDTERQSMRAPILGCFIDQVNKDQALVRIHQMILQGDPAQVITLNAEIVYQAQKDQALRDIINSASLVTPDGIGVVWGGRWLGYPFPERVTGIDILYALCQEAASHQWPVFLLGAAPGVAEEAAGQLVKRCPGLLVKGTHHGYFQEDESPGVVEEIIMARPLILFAALGAPKQEFWIRSHLAEMKVPVCIGVGGSFDVIAGHKKRAPAWMIRLNLEWLYRLLAEPSRWKRQLALPRFALAILRTRLTYNRNARK